jgi:hypothetical protein
MSGEKKARKRREAEALRIARLFARTIDSGRLEPKDRYVLEALQDALYALDELVEAS